MRIIQFIVLIFLTITPHFLFAADYYVATTDLNVRNGAGTEYSVVFTLHTGDKVEVLSKNGSWYKINYLGEIGYAHLKYCRFRLFHGYTPYIVFNRFCIVNNA